MQKRKKFSYDACYIPDEEKAFASGGVFWCLLYSNFYSKDGEKKSVHHIDRSIMPTSPEVDAIISHFCERMKENYPNLQLETKEDEQCERLEMQFIEYWRYYDVIKFYTNWEDSLKIMDIMLECIETYEVSWQKKFNMKISLPEYYLERAKLLLEYRKK